MISWAHRTSLTRLAALLAAAGFFFVTPASAQTQLPPPSFGQADTRQDRIEELERQLREATAENERLQFELNQAQREITRLRALVGELSSVNQSLGQTPPAAAIAPAQQPQATPAPTPATPAPRQTGQLGTLPASDLPGDAGLAYSQARELLVAGRYPEAELAFGRFLQAFPEAETAADARFWFAFTLLARNNYADAAANFVQYLQVAPNGPRAPEAQVRLGMALVGMEQTRQGCSAFASLARRYPNAPRNIRDLAQREARAASCPA
ncbi:MAG: tetratricopeptide repeat protein [Hyphomonadaceae bacterium]|nr:tetratricopeptide repeat protein [Hyphomonadaceae bacterium]